MAVAVQGQRSSEASALPPVAPSVQPHLLTIATMASIAAGVTLIGGLLAIYTAARSTALADGEPWLRGEVPLPNVALAVSYLSLLLSSFTAQWAVAAIKRGARSHMYLAIGVTVLLLGPAFVNGLWFCFDQMGLAAGESTVANAVYALTVTHLLVVVAAHVLFIVMGFRALGGQFSASNRELVNCAAAFWHFAVAAGAAIWVFVWFIDGAPQ